MKAVYTRNEPSLAPLANASKLLAIRTNRGGETTEKFLLFPSGTERRAIADERAIKSFFFPLGLALREREKAGIARAGL